MEPEYVAIPLAPIPEEEDHEYVEPVKEGWVCCRRVDDDFVFVRGPCPENCSSIYVWTVVSIVAAVFVMMFLIFLHILNVF